MSMFIILGEGKPAVFPLLPCFNVPTNTVERCQDLWFLMQEITVRLNAEACPFSSKRHVVLVLMFKF